MSLDFDLYPSIQVYNFKADNGFLCGWWWQQHEKTRVDYYLLSHLRHCISFSVEWTICICLIMATSRELIQSFSINNSFQIFHTLLKFLFFLYSQVPFSCLITLDKNRMLYSIIFVCKSFGINGSWIKKKSAISNR